jgi:hypothetical protein
MHQVMRIRDWTSSDDNGYTKTMESSVNQHHFLNEKCIGTHEPKTIDSKNLPSTMSAMARLIDPTSFSDELASYAGIPYATRMEDSNSTSSFDSLELVKATQELLSLDDKASLSTSSRRTHKRARTRPSLDQERVGYTARQKFSDDFPTIEWSYDQDSSKSMSAIELKSLFFDILTPSCGEDRKSTLLRSKSFASQLGSLQTLEAPIG